MWALFTSEKLMRQSNASLLMKKSTKVSKARIERIRQLGAV